MIQEDESKYMQMNILARIQGLWTNYTDPSFVSHRPYIKASPLPLGSQ